MDLIGLDLARFRRFERASLDTLGRLVAVVGPNEAGKSSLLEAMTRLNDDGQLPGRDLTRGAVPPERQVVVTARFALEGHEKALLADIPEAGQARQFIVRKRRDGTIAGTVEPLITRNLVKRARVRALLAKVGSSRWATTDLASVPEELGESRQILASDPPSFTSEQLDTIDRLATALADEPERTNPRRLSEELAQLIQDERQTHPAHRASAILRSRVPEFLLFAEPERSLGSVYDLNVDADTPPPALRNFAALAGLDVRAARDAAAGGDFGRLETLQRRANEHLSDVFSTGWRQSVMRVQVRLDHNELRPVVGNAGGDFTELGERSDGLRIFVALVAYLAQRTHRVPPVLLIDEAETHLHYDAQADLVRVLSEQDAAAKVIYSTHSAGCLPLDLGTGVRVVAMQAGDRSVVDNNFWTSAPGLTPMVMAMGATALAFTPTRRAVFGEGISESILLPTLIREATGQSPDYQIVPGLANADQTAIDQADMEASRVAFLFDGDKSGRERFKAFRKRGIPADRMLLLGQPKYRDLELEDLVKSAAFGEAVNVELRTWTSKQLPQRSVPARGRLDALSTWCMTEGVEPPDKKRITTQLLRLALEGPILSRLGQEALRDTHAALEAILDRPRLGLAPALTPPAST